MEINALLMNESDNVVTCVREVPAGEEIVYRKGSEICRLPATQTIPVCHKAALVSLAEGTDVHKYGELIGRTTAPIEAGGWVSHENILSVPRDYDAELVPETDEESAEIIPTKTGLKFWGYRRAEGRPGIRNHVLILPGCACGSETSRIVASQVRGAVNIIFNTGCSDVAANTAMSQKVLTGFACNPNVYGVVIIGLGCETVGHKQLREKIQGMTSKPVVSFGIQDEGGTLKTIEKAVRAAREMAAQAAQQQKELFDISELFLGIECGGSDATSGIASNPAVGELSDLLVDYGATAMMSESIEWIGGEHVVAKRAATPKIHNQIIEVCRAYEEHLKAAGQDCRAGQPTPGNKAGGLSTLDEKSLGCIRKGGTRPVVEVLEQAQKPTRHGALVMDTAGYDISSVTSMVAAGCQVVIFTTGRGTPTGNAIVPVLKVTANERTYETRYADVVMGQGNADSQVGTFASTAGWNYDEEVVYPFGYGLSYTTFSQHIDSVEVDVDARTVTAQITVENTGAVAGKTPVQLYVQVPYIAGGVEKSAIQLLDYAKTSVLEPGASETVTIVADLQNMASYDEYGEQTYILDAGDYYFTVANGSHAAVNNVLAAQGYEVSGDAANVQTWHNDSLNKELSTSKAGTEVTNQLQEADYNTWAENTVTYLSRSDWEGTWPQTYDSLSLTEEMLPYLTNDFYTIATDDDTSDITFGGESADGLTFSDMKGVAYDDPMWDDLLNQLDLQEAILFITQGNRNAPAMESIGFVGGQYTENAPNGFNVELSAYSDPNSPWYVAEDDPNAAYMCNDMGSAPLVAATFNKELAEQYGVLWGNDSLYNGLSFIWGPGLNLHRHPYNGRNGEYYSEDPVLSGYTGLSVAQGALTKGLICAPKHFAFNDQESNRNGVAPFMQEQKARELELRSFQIAVEGGTLGLMTSFSRIGPTYVSACTALMTNILVQEWGFEGYAVTDMVNPATYMTWKESVIAGTTNFDTTEVAEEWASYITATTNTLSGDATMLQAIKDRVHNTLYVYAQSNVMNSINSSSQKVEVNVWWRVAYKSVHCGMIALTVLFAAGYVACVAKSSKKKKENA